MNKHFKRIGALALLLLALLCGLYLADEGYLADETALAAMTQVDDAVRTVEVSGRTIAFIPAEPKAGLIFYPGGKVQPEAYAPLMRACAERGMLCVLVKMPGNLAVLSPNAADGIASRYPQVDSWFIGGHSLGGAMAASYAAKHADELNGLILLAAYSTADLREMPLRVLSVYGSEDGVLNRASYAKNRANLPEGFTEVVLAGGCHAYFGSYGAQKGDGTPTLSSGEQIRQTAAQIAEFVFPHNP